MFGWVNGFNHRAVCPSDNYVTADFCGHLFCEAQGIWLAFHIEKENRCRLICRFVRAHVGGCCPRFSSWDTAVTSWAGANGFCRRMLLGTPCAPQSSAAAPVM